MSAADGVFHVADGLCHAYQHGPRYDAVADVQLLDAANRRHRLHVLIIQAVPHVDVQAALAGEFGGLSQRVQLALAIRRRLRLGVAGRLNLHRANVKDVGNLDLARVRIEELVAVTNNGWETMSTIPKQLTVIE